MQRTQEQLDALEKKFKDECKSFYKLSDGTLIRETSDEIIQINENKTGIQLKFSEFEWYGRGSKQFTFGGYNIGDIVWVEIHYNQVGGWIKRIVKRTGNAFKPKLDIIGCTIGEDKCLCEECRCKKYDSLDCKKYLRSRDKRLNITLIERS